MAVYSLCWDVKWFSSDMAKQYKPQVGVIWVESPFSMCTAGIPLYRCLCALGFYQVQLSREGPAPASCRHSQVVIFEQVE